MVLFCLHIAKYLKNEIGEKIVVDDTEIDLAKYD